MRAYCENTPADMGLTQEHRDMTAIGAASGACCCR